MAGNYLHVTNTHIAIFDLNRASNWRKVCRETIRCEDYCMLYKR